MGAQIVVPLSIVRKVPCHLHLTIILQKKGELATAFSQHQKQTTIHLHHHVYHQMEVKMETNVNSQNFSLRMENLLAEEEKLHLPAKTHLTIHLIKVSIALFVKEKILYQ